MIDINDYTSCWVCDNIVDHQEQIGLLHLDFPRCFILIPDNTAFQMECAADYQSLSLLILQWQLNELRWNIDKTCYSLSDLGSLTCYALPVCL